MDHRQVFLAVKAGSSLHLLHIHHLAPGQRCFSPEIGRSGIIFSGFRILTDGRLACPLLSDHHSRRTQRIGNISGCLDGVQLFVQMENIVSEMVGFFCNRRHKIQRISMIQIIPGYFSDDLLAQRAGADDAHGIAGTTGKQLELDLIRAEIRDLLIRIQRKGIFLLTKRRIDMCHSIMDGFSLNFCHQITSAQRVQIRIAFEHKPLDLPCVQNAQNFLVH